MPPSDLDAIRRELKEALKAEDPTERMLGVVGAVDGALAGLEVRPVVVGGLAVQYWTHGHHATYDIDVLLPSSEAVYERLASLGFVRQGRHWVLPREPLFLEMPGDFIDADADVDEVELPNGRRLLMLSLEDVLLYRLHSFTSTGHLDSARQAVSLLALEELDQRRLDQRVQAEGLTEALSAIRTLADRAARGEELEAHEVHDLARRVRGEKGPA